MLAGRWKATFEEYRKQGSPVPPVLIVACQDTGLSELVHEYIGLGRAQHELRNLPAEERTIRKAHKGKASRVAPRKGGNYWQRGQAG